MNRSVIILQIIGVTILMPLFGMAKNGASEEDIQNSVKSALQSTKQTNGVFLSPMDELKLQNDGLERENKSLEERVELLSGDNKKLETKVKALEEDRARLNEELDKARKKLVFVMVDALFRPFNKELYNEMILPLIESVKKSKELYENDMTKGIVLLSENELQDIQSLIDLLSQTKSQFSFTIPDMNKDSGKAFINQLKAMDCYIRYTNTLKDWKESFLGKKMAFLLNEFAKPKENSEKLFVDLMEELQQLL